MISIYQAAEIINIKMPNYKAVSGFPLYNAYVISVQPKNGGIEYDAFFLVSKDGKKIAPFNPAIDGYMEECNKAAKNMVTFK